MNKIAFVWGIIFLVSIDVLMRESHKYSYDIPWWILVIIFGVMGLGLIMLIQELIDDAKKDLQNEIDELRSEIRGR